MKVASNYAFKHNYMARLSARKFQMSTEATYFWVAAGGIEHVSKGIELL